MNKKKRTFSDNIATPYLAIEVGRLTQALKDLQQLKAISGVSPLFAPKACSIPFVLEELTKYVDGFACSSMNELRLVQTVSPATKLHFTTPGIRPDEIDELGHLCGYMTFNSLPHMETFCLSIEK